MLLQTNSYIVPKDKRFEHSRLCRRFRQTLLRLGCDHFEVYEQVGSNWSNSESTGRYVQIMRFVDRKHQLAVQAAERVDPTAQAVIAEFCNLINFPYQQQQGLFAVGFYTSVLPATPKRSGRSELVSTVEHEVVEEQDSSMEDMDEESAPLTAGEELGDELGDELAAGMADDEPIRFPGGAAGVERASFTGASGMIDGEMVEESDSSDDAGDAGDDRPPLKMPGLNRKSADEVDQFLDVTAAVTPSINQPQTQVEAERMEAGEVRGDESLDRSPPEEPVSSQPRKIPRGRPE
jgi:hypothetical protein